MCFISSSNTRSGIAISDVCKFTNKRKILFPFIWLLHSWKIQYGINTHICVYLCVRRSYKIASDNFKQASCLCQFIPEGHLKVMQTQDIWVAGWDSNALRDIPQMPIESHNHNDTPTTKYPHTFLKSPLGAV